MRPSFFFFTSPLPPLCSPWPTHRTLTTSLASSSFSVFLSTTAAAAAAAQALNGQSCCDVGGPAYVLYPNGTMVEHHPPSISTLTTTCNECWSSSLSLIKGDLDGTANLCTMAAHCQSPTCTNEHLPITNTMDHSLYGGCNHFPKEEGTLHSFLNS